MARVVLDNIGVEYFLGNRGIFSRGSKKLWALKDVSFELSSGDVLGVVGRNGGGKSTLLQVLAGILPPDQGSIIMEGSMPSLLSLSAGFRPELTGRENVYLGGIIQGLTRKEVELYVPEIQEFAGLGDFFDQPVKQYSSGMRARLGFALAMSIQSEILLIDEVLGVGDNAFQKKARQKIKDLIGNSGIAIIVSHNLTFIQEFCNKGIWLDQTLRYSGDAESAVKAYLQ